MAGLAEELDRICTALVSLIGVAWPCGTFPGPIMFFLPEPIRGVQLGSNLQSGLPARVSSDDDGN